MHDRRAKKNDATFSIFPTTVTKFIVKIMGGERRGISWQLEFINCSARKKSLQYFQFCQLEQCQIKMGISNRKLKFQDHPVKGIVWNIFHLCQWKLLNFPTRVRFLIKGERRWCFQKKANMYRRGGKKKKITRKPRTYLICVYLQLLNSST